MRSTTIIAFLVLGGLLCLPACADNYAAIQHYNSAVDLATAGKFPEALNEVDLALQENPNFTLALVTKGGILNVMGRYNESINATDQALALDPGQAAAWNNRAYALIHLGANPAGLAAAEQATALDPNLTEGWVNEGTALLRLGRYQEALVASEKALALDPGSQEAKLNRDEARQMLQPPATTTPLAGILVYAGLGAAGFLAVRKMQ